jgi:hypothetical protein
MRIFEFHEDEHVHSSTREVFTHGTPRMIVDLDSIVMLQETTLKDRSGRAKSAWYVTFVQRLPLPRYRSGFWQSASCVEVKLTHYQRLHSFGRAVHKWIARPRPRPWTPG